MPTRLAIVVASLAEARAALAADRAAVLHSPPGAAGFQGIGWWRALLAALRAEFGEVATVLDCGNAPGLALAAIRDGIPCLLLDAPPEVFAKVRAMGEAAGCAVLPPG